MKIHTQLNYKISDTLVPFTGTYFSQWAETPFRLHGVPFNCAEQAMMFFKASVFEDEDAGDLIMASNSPSEQKKLGRAVQNYDDQIWQMVALDCVTMINYAKFTQAGVALDYLLATGNDHIVEAAPWDKVWGIGMDENHKDFNDPTKWKGTNHLGIAIMNARELITNPTFENIDTLYTLALWTNSAAGYGVEHFEYD